LFDPWPVRSGAIRVDAIASTAIKKSGSFRAHSQIAIIQEMIGHEKHETHNIEHLQANAQAAERKNCPKNSFLNFRTALPLN
jgi:hypothetical protein